MMNLSVLDSVKFGVVSSDQIREWANKWANGDVYELDTPVANFWFSYGEDSIIGLLLDMTQQDLERSLYFEGIKNDDDEIEQGYGAEYIRKRLSEVDVNSLCAELKEKLETASGDEKVHLEKRLEVAEAFRITGKNPEWMVLDVLPGVPKEWIKNPYCRDSIKVHKRRRDNRCVRYKRLLELEAPNVILCNEKMLIQRAADAYIDNKNVSKPVALLTENTRENQWLLTIFSYDYEIEEDEDGGLISYVAKSFTDLIEENDLFGSANSNGDQNIDEF